MLTSQLLTALVTTINGAKRAERSQEWAADLAQATADEKPPSIRLRHSAGLVVAALRMRMSGLAQTLRRALCWILAEPRAQATVVLAVTLCTAGYWLDSTGWAALMANFENVLAAAGLTSVFLFCARIYLGIPSKASGRRHDAARKTADLSQPCTDGVAEDSSFASTPGTVTSGRRPHHRPTRP